MRIFSTNTDNKKWKIVLQVFYDKRVNKYDAGQIHGQTLKEKEIR